MKSPLLLIAGIERLLNNKQKCRKGARLKKRMEQTRGQVKTRK
jgi:hypothetical protein